MKWAFETLERYRKKFCMFNDDIQVITWLNIFLSLMETHTIRESAGFIICASDNLVFAYIRELQELHLQDYWELSEHKVDHYSTL